MATPLTKSVKRQTLRMIEQQGKYKNRAIIVALLPGDDISFRIKGTKKVFTIYLGYCYRLAQMQTAESEYRKAVENFNLKKSIGKRARKPQRPQLPFHNIFYKAINK